MKAFSERFDSETIQASDRFITRIRENILKKQLLPNDSDDYPIEKAADSFDAFLKSDPFREILSDDKN